jgi:hypothetical protein
MFKNREEVRRKLLEVVEKFRQKRVTSQEKAMIRKNWVCRHVLKKRCIEDLVKEEYSLK